MEAAYGAFTAVTNSNDGAGVALSSVSAPSVVTAMLEQAGVRRGLRVLEIGAGAGYNAALLAHLVGARGQVTTIAYDRGIADARAPH